MELHTDDKIISRQSNWVFDEHVAPEFDKHVKKSVPNYLMNILNCKIILELNLKKFIFINMAVNYLSLI